MKALLLEQVREHPTPPGRIAIWWLGQAGFILKSPGGKILALDPYLSNSCKALGEEHGFDMDRRIPAPMTAEDLVGIDLYMLTHSHQDHLDPETLGPYRAAGGKGPFLAPAETVEKLETLGVPSDQIVTTWPNKSVAVGDFSLQATFAIPFAEDDLTHVGYLVKIEEGPVIYFTGDTGYHDVIGASVRPRHPDVLVTVINGAFRNLGPAEAAQLAQQIDAQVVIPCHYDLFGDNAQYPQMLRTNLKILGLGSRYRLLEHGTPYTYPED